jgi:hypothetical protein
MQVERVFAADDEVPFLHSGASEDFDRWGVTDRNIRDLGLSISGGGSFVHSRGHRMAEGRVHHQVGGSAVILQAIHRRSDNDEVKELERR